MPISQTQFFSELSAGHSGPPIPRATLTYYQARLRNRLFNFILKRFVREQKNGLTKAALARRIGKSPEVINRLLGAPRNLTLDTLSDLLLGIGAEELTLEAESILNQSPRNYLHADWIRQEDQIKRAQPPRPRESVLGPVTSVNTKITSDRKIQELLGARWNSQASS
jgi:transcriptional regulator with XRE-family HTH domain